MKKFLAILLAAMMLLTLAACGENTDKSSGSGKNNSGTSQNGNQGSAEGLEDALSVLLPEGWDENKYGAYIYDVWDSDFLPDCFPSAPEGAKVDQTNFKDYDHDTLNGDYSVGPVIYDSYEDYREYGVGFYGNLEHLQSFVAAVEAKGMTGGQTEDGDWLVFDYYGNGWFMEIFAQAQYSSDREFDYYISVNATDTLFTLPAAVDGIPLPQVGMTDCDYNKYYYITDFSNGYDEVNFDLSKDSLPAEYYVAWFNYYGTVNQNAIDYAQQMKGLGWEVEWESDGEDGYRCCLKKGGIYMVVNYYDYECMLEVGFSDMVENLSY